MSPGARSILQAMQARCGDGDVLVIDAGVTLTMRGETI